MAGTARARVDVARRQLRKVIGKAPFVDGGFKPE
jgi:hypothetical protein